MAKKGKRKAAPGDIATNRQAGFRYNLLEKFEAGIVLQGSEVKSMRQGGVQLKDKENRGRELPMPAEALIAEGDCVTPSATPQITPTFTPTPTPTEVTPPPRLPEPLYLPALHDQP